MTELPTAVIVSYHPPAGFAQRLRAVLAQTARILIVDNGAGDLAELASLDTDARARVQVIDSGGNIGLAAALDLGIAAARQQGARQVLLLDHDSTPAADMVSQLLRARAAAPEPSLIAVVVPQIRYAHPDIRCRWPAAQPQQRLRFAFAYATQMRAPQPVLLAIGSGMLLDVAIWQRLGGFDARLFIDLVDTEYCLRARAQGFTILAAPRAQLAHALGDVEKRRALGLDMFPTHHSPLRHYYLSRNRCVLMRRYALSQPNWLIYETLGALKLTLKVALFEPGRLHKFAAMLRGTRDGLRMALRDPGAPHGHV
ncbi:glycosyltransferase family 2 protein [Sinimarinibacterium sp. NLF-5-8]|uniref:glycosyltransferase family 2 protein n=1 Tax=Sinimarinibacterium sp. NLF-5-8 TaxID=2698684 RepID=UPI00137BF2BA|nr:glycosyltransferase family 2 protein [Sinimarinibacterium sp. NLF-5-8]QHS10540.1 glycosyltransferase family 2 protein [Sinimarinibacterium sp. NLF-5-8]